MAKQIYVPDAGAQVSINHSESASGTDPAAVTYVFAPVHYAAPQTVTRSALYVEYQITATLDSDHPLGVAQAQTRIRYSINSGGAYTAIIDSTNTARDGNTVNYDTGVTGAIIAMPASFDLSNLRLESMIDLACTGSGTPTATATVRVIDSYVGKPYRHIIMAG